MTLLQDMSLRILSKMETKDLKKSKSVFGILEICCSIVEEAYKRLKKVAESKDKRCTAVFLVHPLINRLDSEGLLAPLLKNKLESLLNDDSLNEMVDEVIIVWKENLEEVRGCLRLGRFMVKVWKNENTTVNLKHVRID